MIWTVIYRGDNGKREMVEIEAADRNGVFAELKRHGITAVSVSEGKRDKGRGKRDERGRHGGGRTGVRPSRGMVRGLLARLVVVVGAVAAWWWFKPDAAERVPPAKPGKAKPVAIPAPPRVKALMAKTNGAESASNANASASTATTETWLGTPVVRHDVVTNGTLIVETFYTSDGKKHKYYHDEREKALPSGADQILAMMTANNGYGAPPLPSVSDFESDFGDALKNEIVIKESDTKEVREIKERVIAARKELLELTAEGHSANDVLREWQAMQEDNATVRLEAVSKVRELLAEGDREGAKELCNQYNAVLERAGIMPIELPANNTRMTTHAN